MAQLIDSLKVKLKKRLDDLSGDVNLAYQRSGLQYAPERAKATALESFGKSAQALQNGISWVANRPRIELPSSKAQNPLVRGTINLAKSVPESLINIPRNYTVGIARTGKEIGESTRDRRLPNLQKLAGGVVPLAESLFDVGTMGLTSVGKNIAKEGVRKAAIIPLKRIALTGTRQGAKYGGLGGLTYGLDNQYGKKFNAGGVAGNVVAGAALGGVLGGGMAGAGGVFTKLKTGYRGLGFDDQTAGQLAKKHYASSENVTVKLRTPRAQKEFNAKVNSVLGRPMDTPVFSDDLKKYINKTNKLPDTEFGIGLGIKERNRNKSITPKIKLTKPKQRGFVTSVEASPKNVSKGVKLKVTGEYQPKPNKQLMGEVKVLLSELPEGSNIKFEKVTDIDQKVAATIQEAINLDKRGKHDAAANLYNNLARYGTELGRGVQAFSLLDRMSPAAISKTVAARIQQYNKTARNKLPELTGEQQKLISKAVDKIGSFAPGSRERNMAVNELQRTLNSFIPSSITDKAITVWKAGLLTSLRTHERNLVGNTIMGASEVGKDLIASPVDWLMSQKTGQRNLTFTPKTGQGYQKGFQAAKDMVQYGYDPEETITKFDLHQINWGKNPVEQALKKYTDAVFRTLGAEDKVPWNTAFARSLYDQAGAAAINARKQGDKKFIQNLVKNPSETMLTTATNDANYATFKDPNKLSSLASTMKHWARERWYTQLPAEVLAPFTGVPSSVAGKTIDYSPIGLVKGAVDVGRVMLSNTPLPELQRQAAQEVGRGVMGTGLYALGAYLMSQGLMTGQPKDATEARQWQLENKPANSIWVNGKWRSINSVGPQTLIMLSGAKLNEAMTNPDMGMGGYAAALGKDQLSQTFLQGVQQPLAALTDPNRYGKSYLGNQGSSIIPNIVKDTSKALDPYVRENNTVGDYFKNSIPLVRNQNIPKRDALGNIILQQPTGISAYIDLFNSKTPISNQVVDELARLNNANANATPGNLTKNQTIGGVKTTLTPAQLNELETAIGPQVTQALTQLFVTPEYRNLPDQDKGEAIDDVVASVRKQVRGNLTVDRLAPTKTNRPTVTQVSAAETGGEQLMIVNPETGSVKTINLDWEPPELNLTGSKELDKKLKSKYTSALTSRINDIVTLYENGKLTQEEAEAQIAAINALKTSSGGSSKKISLGTPAKLKPIQVSAAPAINFQPIRLSPGSSSQPISFTPQRAKPQLKLKLKQLPGVKLA